MKSIPKHSSTSRKPATRTWDTPAVSINAGPILGFAIVGKDGEFQPAKAVWGTNVNKQEDHSVIVLSSPLVAEPAYYRHAWGRNLLANLKVDGIPLDTLRKDNWTIADKLELYTGKKADSNWSAGGLARALGADDVKRRLKSAKTFIKEHSDTSKAPYK